MRLFALIGGTLVLALLLALVVPPFVDWTTFRAQFEREATRVLGQPVRVAGATSARLLPWPKVEFEDVAIGEDGAGGPLLALDRLAFDVELAPLLKGDVTIVSMDLDRPRGTLTLRDDGSLDWFERRGGPRVPASSVSIEALTVTNGAFTVRDLGRNVSFALADLDATLEAESLAGPWRGEGAFTHEGERFLVSGTTGALREEGDAARLATRLTLTPLALPYDLTVSGPVTLSDAGVSLDGTFAVAPSTSDEPGVGTAAVAPVRVDGRVVFDRERLELPGFEVTVGEGDDPYRLEGSAKALFGAERSYELVLEGAQVDIDRFAGRKPLIDEEPPNLRERLARAEAVLRRVPLPALPGTIRLKLPAVVAGDTVIRDLNADLRPLANRSGWNLALLEATLPGRTLVEASGALAVPSDPAEPLAFTGDLLVASRQPSGLARWLGGEVDPAIRALDRAGLQGKVVFSAEGARFDDTTLRLGEDRLSGSLARLAPRDGARPVLQANLEGDAVDVDRLIALFALFSDDPLKPGDVAGHTLDLRLRADAARAFDLAARDVDLVALYDGTDLVLDRLTFADLEGASVDVQGRIADLETRPSGRLDGSFAVDDAGRLAALAEKRLSVPAAFGHLLREPALLSGTQVDFTLDAASAGGDTEVALDLDGRVGSTNAVGRFVLEGAPAASDPRVELKLALENDEPNVLLRQLGFRPRDGALAGPVAAELDVRGRPSALELSASLELPDARFETAGASRFVEGQGDRYEGAFAVEAGNLDPVLRASGLPLPGIGDGTPVSLKGGLTADADKVSLDEVSGTVRGTEIAGRVVLDATAEPRPRLDGRLALSFFDLRAFSQLVFGPDFAFGTDTTLGSPLLAGLDGDVALTAERADLGLDLLPAAPAANLRASLEIDDGSLALDDLFANWLEGDLKGGISLAKVGESGALGLQLAVDGAEVRETGLVDGTVPRLAGTFDLEVALESQGRDARELVSGLSGGARFRLRDGSVRGIAPDGFARLLAAADETDDARLEAVAPRLARRTVLTGEAPLSDVSVPLTVANGVGRASNVPLDIGGLDAALDLRVDLATLEADGALRAGYAEPDGADAVEGVSPNFRVDFAAGPRGASATLDATTLTTYLATRLRERREREFAAQRAAILERQRLVRAMRLSRERERRDRAAVQSPAARSPAALTPVRDATASGERPG